MNERPAMNAKGASLRGLLQKSLEYRTASQEDRVAEGQQLFQDYQCLGCHRVGNSGNEVGPHLDGVGSRLQPQYMRSLILDPQTIIPGTAIKNLQLWDDEADAIVQYLISLK